MSDCHQLVTKRLEDRILGILAVREAHPEADLLEGEELSISSPDAFEIASWEKAIQEAGLADEYRAELSKLQGKASA